MLNHWRYKIKYRHRLFFFLLTIAVIPILFVGIISVKISSETLIEKQISDTCYKMKELGKDIEDFVREKELSLLRIALDVNVLKAIKADTDDEALLRIEELLFEEMIDTDLQSIYILGRNGLNISNSFSSEDYKKIAYLHDLEFDSKVKSEKAFEFRNQYFLPLIRRIEDSLTIESEGVVILNIREYKIKELLLTSTKAVNGKVFLLDDQNFIITSTEDSVPGTRFEDVFNNKVAFSFESGYKYFDFNGKEYMLTYFIDENDWKYVNVIPVAEVLSSAFAISRLTTLAGVVTFLLCILFAYLLSSYMTKPISRLIDIMDNAENGNLDIDFKYKYKDEIGKLAESFNAMIFRLKNQIEETLTSQRREKEAEYEALMLQINPHFLHNTLSTIMWLTENDQKEQVYKLTNELSMLFRLYINKDEKTIKVSEELAHLKMYIDIQRVRYDNKFECIYDMDIEIRSCVMLKILMQPLVENAISHGLNKVSSGGIIKIVGKKKEDHIVFEVMDNGRAMSGDCAKALNESLKSERKSSFSGVGVKNVYDRIKIHYGDKYYLEFEIKGIWTIARVIIPIIKGR